MGSELSRASLRPRMPTRLKPSGAMINAGLGHRYCWIARRLVEIFLALSYHIRAPPRSPFRNRRSNPTARCRPCFVHKHPTKLNILGRWQQHGSSCARGRDLPIEAFFWPYCSMALPLQSSVSRHFGLGLVQSSSPVSHASCTSFMSSSCLSRSLLLALDLVSVSPLFAVACCISVGRAWGASFSQASMVLLAGSWAVCSCGCPPASVTRGSEFSCSRPGPALSGIRITDLSPGLSSSACKARTGASPVLSFGTRIGPPDTYSFNLGSAALVSVLDGPFSAIPAARCCLGTIGVDPASVCESLTATGTAMDPMRGTVFSGHLSPKLFERSSRFATNRSSLESRPFRVRGVQGAQLQLQKGCKTGRYFRMEPACIDVGDQPIHCVPHPSHTLQSGQRLGILGNGRALTAAPNPPQLRRRIQKLS